MNIFLLNHQKEPPYYLQPLLIKVFFEKKEVILLMGGFNINLLNCNTDKDTSFIFFSIENCFTFYKLKHKNC